MSQPYTIIWKRSLIETDIASYLVRAMEQGEDVGAIARSMTMIDRHLSHWPEMRGESRGGFERVLIVQPLAVTYEIYEEERIVYILHVGYSPRR